MAKKKATKKRAKPAKQKAAKKSKKQIATDRDKFIAAYPGLAGYMGD